MTEMEIIFMLGVLAGFGVGILATMYGIIKSGKK